MKKQFLLLCMLAFLLCACAGEPVETTTAPETTAVPVTTIADPSALAMAVPIDTYESDTYTVTEYRNSDDSVIYWTVVTKSILHPQEFRYDRDENAGPIPSVTTLVAEADINFDGRTDLCLLKGYFGAQGVRLYIGYLQNADGTYTLCEGFENIADPALDAENKVILSTSRENAAQHRYGKYAFAGNAVKCTDALIYTVGDETVEMDGVVYSIASDSPDRDRFLGEGGAWELEGAKWCSGLVAVRQSGVSNE